jgi:thioredoxin reductase
MVEIVIVGGGPAGLSAALVAGRSRRETLLCDTGQGRNLVSAASHSFFTQDGTPPASLREIGLQQLEEYPSVTVRSAGVDAIERTGATFRLQLSDGTAVETKIVILATGVEDDLPPIEGLRGLWGRKAFPCPYCDGWEVRDRPLAVLANDQLAAPYVRMIHHWSQDLVWVTNGEPVLDETVRDQIASLGIPIIDNRIVAMRETASGISIEFDGHEPVERHAIFLRSRVRPRNELAVSLGCEIGENPMNPGLIIVDQGGRTTVPGVYAAGDVSGTMPPQIAYAVASGLLAASTANHELILG